MEPTITPPERKLPSPIPPRIPPRLTQASDFVPKPAKLIIDNQNISIPRGVDLDTYLRNLKRNFKRYGFSLGSVDLVNLDFSKLWPYPKPQSSRAILDNKEDLTVTLHWVEETQDDRREDCDIEIEFMLLEYAIVKNPPFVVVLASADTDYIEQVETLRSTYHTEIYLSAHKVSAGTVSKQNCYVDYDLLAGDPNQDYSPEAQLYLTPTARPIVSDLHQEEPNLVVVQVDGESTYVLPFLSTASQVANPSSHMERIHAFLLSRKQKAHSIEGFVFTGSIEFPSATGSVTKTTLALDFLSKSHRANGIQIRALDLVRPKKRKKRTSSMGFVDVKMTKMMYYWALKKLPPAPIMLITKDLRLMRGVKKMKEFGFDVIVATDMNDSLVRESFENTAFGPGEGNVSVISWE